MGVRIHFEESPLWRRLRDWLLGKEPPVEPPPEPPEDDPDAEEHGLEPPYEEEEWQWHD